MQAAQNRRPARAVALPPELHPEVAAALRAKGIDRLWSHQADALHAAWAGPTIVTTGTASGKSLCFQLPDARRRSAATAAPARSTSIRPRRSRRTRRARCTGSAWRAPGPRSTTATRRARSGSQIRRRANVILTNPDMLHLGILPNHRAWADVFANLAVVVVDEAHVYRGVFGSHVANVLRRLRRIAAAYGTEPRFLLASATIANPGELAERLTGLPEVTVIDRDGSPGGRRTIAMWNPPITDEQLATRRSAARRGGRPARRARRRGRAHDRVHEVAQGGRADGALRPARARGPGPPRARRPDRALPRRLHAAAAARARAPAGGRRAARRRLDRRARARASTSARSTRRSA